MSLLRSRMKILQRHWRDMARRDARWAVLTDPAKKGGQWADDEFYATGRATVAAHLARWAEASGGKARAGREGREGRALDFGCGVGRLTWALHDHFEAVVGVDIAEEMLAQARVHRPATEAVQFVLNAQPDLRAWADGSFDFVYSHLVLQHNAVELMEVFIAEFCRVCRSGGYVMFQLPAQRVAARARKEWWLWLWPPVVVERTWRALNRVVAWRGEMEVNVLPAERVEALLRANGMGEVRRWDDDSAGAEYRGFQYLARKD